MRSEQIVIQNLLTSYVVSEVPASPARTVIFLHGWASSKEVWGQAMGSLAAPGVTSYAIDLPGFGKTDSAPTAWSVSDYAEFVAEFLQKLKIQQAIIVGHSFGGRVGLVLAATHAPLVRKLVLVDSAGVRTAARAKKVLALFSKFVRPFFRLRWTQPLRKKIYRVLGAADYVATPELNKTFVKVIGEDLTKYLGSISQPTLLVWGKNDLVTPVSYAEHFSGHLKDSRLVVLPGAGHYSFLDKPKEFLSALTEFI